MIGVEKMRELSEDTLAALSLARLRAIALAPYYARILGALTYVPMRGLATLGIDERLRLYVDPVVLGEWTSEELTGVLLHEVNHVLRNHGERCRSMSADEDLWNIAADAEINDDLVAGGFALPGVPVTPSLLGCEDGQTAEWYYTRIAPDGPSVECGSGAHGRHRHGELGADSSEYPGIPPHRVDALRDMVAEEVRANAGTTGRGLARWAEQRAKSVVPWQQVLYAAVGRGPLVRAGQVDYSWSRPNRRHQGNVILPTLRMPRTSVAVVIDTSASMHQDDLDRAYSETKSIASRFGDARALLVSCDTVATVISRGPLPQSVEMVGGGGTDMGAALQLLASEVHVPDMIIVLTDGETPWPTDPPQRLGTSKIVVGVVRSAGSSSVHQTPVQVPEWCIRVDIPVDGCRTR